MCKDTVYNYMLKQKTLREQIAEVDKFHKDLMEVLDMFNGKKILPINYNQLLKFPLFEWVALNDKVSIRRRKMLFGDHINFDTKILKDGEFGKHFHDDVIESTELRSGKLIDKEDNKIYYAGDVMHYDKGVSHRPVALEDTILRVIFKP